MERDDEGEAVKAKRGAGSGIRMPLHNYTTAPRQRRKKDFRVRSNH